MLSTQQNNTYYAIFTQKQFVIRVRHAGHNTDHPRKNELEESKMAWQPDEHGLKQILDLLKESQSSDNAIQRAVQQVSFLR